MLGLTKNLKTKHGNHVGKVQCNNAIEDEDLNGFASRKGWALSLSMLPQVFLFRTAV